MSRRIIAVYSYHDEQGVVRHETVRYSDKTFKQRRPNGRGGFIWNLRGVTRLPFNLPDVMARPLGEWIDYPEGEKDWGTFNALGLVATTNAEGAGAELTPEFVEYFRARKVTVWCDNDEVGLAGGQRHALALAGVANEVRIVTFPADRPKGYDVTDFVDEGHDRADIESLRDAARIVEAQLGPSETSASEGGDSQPIEDGAALLDDLARTYREYVAFPSHYASTLALFVLHTHAFEAADVTPYIYLRSPESECGKSLVLSISKHLCRRGIHLANVTPATTFRLIDALTPTCLIDEVDAIFGPRRSDRSEELRSVLDFGFERGGVVPRCGGKFRRS